MTEIEIELTKAYLHLAGQDPIAALIRSVRDLTRARGTFDGFAEIVPASLSDQAEDRLLADAA